MLKHDANLCVKSNKNVLETPGFMRFLQLKAGQKKKSHQTADLCTFVAFTPTSPWIPLRDVEGSRQIKTAAGLPDGDSNVSPRTLFTEVQALENNAKVAGSLALTL